MLSSYVLAVSLKIIFDFLSPLLHFAVLLNVGFFMVVSRTCCESKYLITEPVWEGIEWAGAILNWIHTLNDK